MFDRVRKRKDSGKRDVLTLWTGWQIAPPFTASQQAQVKSLPVSGHTVVQNSVLYTHIIQKPLLASQRCSPDSWRAEHSQQIVYSCSLLDELFWIFLTHSRTEWAKTSWTMDHFFSNAHCDGWCCLHLMLSGGTVCESELISFRNNNQLIKSGLWVYRTIILKCPTGAITFSLIFKFRSVHMY